MATPRTVFKQLPVFRLHVGLNLARAIAIALFAFATSAAIGQSPAQGPPLTPAEQQCYSSVKGKVAYDTQGHRIERDVTVLSLCRGTTDPAATIACFQSAMPANNQWQTAINACNAQAGTGPRIGANAENLYQAEFGMNGQRLGKYQWIKPNTWLEIHADATPGFEFHEQRRDARTVYLFDSSRHVNIQLDLGKHQVLYADADAPTPRLLYNIRAAFGPPAGTSMAPTISTGPVPAHRVPAAEEPGPGTEPRPIPSQPRSTALTGNGQIDNSFAVLRCGAVTNAQDAGNKCSSVCQNYQGFSGNWAVTVQPNLAACQCKAKLDPTMKATEVIATHIKTNDDAARVCPTACQYYGGGDGTWRDRDATHSICGCAEALH